MEGTRRPLQKQGCEHLAGDNAIYQQAWDVRPPPELSYEEQAQGFLSCPHTSEMEATGELGRQLSGGSSTHLHSWVWVNNMAQWVKMLAAKPEFNLGTPMVATELTSCKNVLYPPHSQTSLVCAPGPGGSLRG